MSKMIEEVTVELGSIKGELTTAVQHAMLRLRRCRADLEALDAPSDVIQGLDEALYKWGSVFLQ